jgi:hypothetical protein
MTKEEELAFDLALKALENSVDLVREDAYNAEKLYGNYPSRQGKVAGLKVLADDHEKAITAIRQVRSAPVQESAKRVCSLGCKNLGACCADPMCEAVAAIPPAQPAVQEPVGYTDGDGRAWAVKWSGALPPNLTLFASAINHLQEKTMAKHIDPRKGGSKPRESP